MRGISGGLLYCYDRRTLWARRPVAGDWIGQDCLRLELVAQIKRKHSKLADDRQADLL